MNMSLITPKEYATSHWAGGTTTQLAIAPDDSLYQDREFLWRISSAIVEQDHCDFTLLTDYDRRICILQGEIELTHNNGEAISLSPYTVHCFDGGANTSSEGRCVDFNLMTRKERCQGSLQAVILEGGGHIEILSADTGFTVLIYCHIGGGAVRAGSKCLRLSAEESILVEDAANSVLSLEGTGVFMLAKLWR